MRHALLPLTLCVLAACGSTGEDTPEDTSGWRQLAPMPGGPRQETAVVELGGLVYVIGGLGPDGAALARVERYDPRTDTWSAVASLPLPLHHPNAAALDGALYVVGALGPAGFGATGQVLRYEPAADRWTERTPMPGGTERGASGVAVLEGRIYVLGGSRGRSVAEVSRYHPASDTWEPLPPLPAARDHLVGAALEGTVYAIGGRSEQGLSGNVDALRPSVGAWQARSPMPTPRAGCAAAALPDGRVLVMGGEGNRADPAGMFSQTEVYVARSDAWGALAPMRTPRHGIGAAVIDGQVYVPGGATREGLGAVSVLEAFAAP